MWIWALSLVGLWGACVDSGPKPVDGGPQGTVRDASVWEYGACFLDYHCPMGIVRLGLPTMSRCASTMTWMDAYYESLQEDGEAARYLAKKEVLGAMRSCEEYNAWYFCDEDELARFEGSELHWYCSDDTALACSDSSPSRASRFDCGAAGLTCEDGFLEGGCGFGSCDEESFERRCEEDLLVLCEFGQIAQVDCGDALIELWYSEIDGRPVSNRCGERADGSFGWMGDGVDCDEEGFSLRCDGSVMETCTGGKIGRLDCNDIIPNTVCGEDNLPWLRCWPKDSDCDPRSNEKCQDGRITFCDFGRWVRIDCKEAGFSDCHLNDIADVMGQGDMAHCIP
ncbi:MAG: hypothetical protein JRF33_00460 [Deltaproteobacteria bacterium]|nr:hypothetical protein [Deltaproteobacteria bacterium]